MYLAHAFTASTEPWNRPGRSGDPVSAITVTVIVVRAHADLGRLQRRRLAHVGGRRCAGARPSNRARRRRRSSCRCRTPINTITTGLRPSRSASRFPLTRQHPLHTGSLPRRRRREHPGYEKVEVTSRKPSRRCEKPAAIRGRSCRSLLWMRRESEIRFLRFAGRRVAYAVTGDGPPLVAPAWWVSHLELDWSDQAFREFWESVAEGYTLGALRPARRRPVRSRRARRGSDARR